jgi:hypothetical protein
MVWLGCVHVHLMDVNLDHIPEKVGEDGADQLLHWAKSGAHQMSLSLCCRVQPLYLTRSELLPTVSGCESCVRLVLR